jgi:hypothetical protein
VGLVLARFRSVLRVMMGTILLRLPVLVLLVVLRLMLVRLAISSLGIVLLAMMPMDGSLNHLEIRFAYVMLYTINKVRHAYFVKRPSLTVRHVMMHKLVMSVSKLIILIRHLQQIKNHVYVWLAFKKFKMFV